MSFKVHPFLTVLLVFLFCSYSYSNDDGNDENTILPADRTKIENLITKANEHYSINSDSCLIYAEEAMRLAKANRSPVHEAQAVDVLSNYYFDNEKYAESIKYLDQQIILYTDLGDSLKKAQTYNILGLADYNLGRYDESVHAYHLAIQLAIAESDDNLLAKMYQNLGVLYAELNMADKAMEYYQKALDLHRINKNRVDEAGILQNIGIIYADEEEYREALGYYLSALKIYNDLNDSLSIALMYLNLGTLYEKQNNYPRALKYYQSSLVSFLKEEYQLGIAYSYISIGSVYKKTGSYASALENLLLSLEYSKAISLVENEVDCHLELAEVYALLKDYTNAYEEMRIYNQLFNSLYNDNVHQEVAEMETRINAQIKEKEIADLRLEREKAERDMIRTIIAAVIIITLTLIIIAVIVYYSRTLRNTNLNLVKEIKERTKAEKELLSIKNSLEERVLERTSELEKAKLKAEESDRLKSAFIANMSHEIRTPLNAITGFAGLLLREDVEAEKKKEYNEQIIKNNKILIKMIEDLIDTSKIESGSLQLHPSKINLEQFLQQFIEPVTENMARKSKPYIDIILDEPSVSFKTFTADAVRLQQVLWHFLDNAVKFTKKGSIHYGCKPEGKKALVFYVSDTGIGIADKYKNVIFEKFRQLDGSTNRHYGGTGLGLYYAKKIAEVMGGKIWLESNENKGSTFYFSLPFSK